MLLSSHHQSKLDSFSINGVMKVIAFMEPCRYVNDGKPFWQYIVSSSTGCSDSQYFEELYNYYTTNKVNFWQPLFRLGIPLFFMSSIIILTIFLLIMINLLQAWHLCDPDAERVFKALRQAGVKIAIVSNFDTRLRPLLRALNCDHWFDAVAVSAEVSLLIPFHCFFCISICFC